MEAYIRSSCTGILAKVSMLMHALTLLSVTLKSIFKSGKVLKVVKVLFTPVGGQEGSP